MTNDSGSAGPIGLSLDHSLSGSDRQPQTEAGTDLGPPPDRHAIVVLGMHRSGTSALTRVLGLRGAALPKRTIPPAPSNEAGHWEPSAIVAIHEEILASVGSSYHDLSEFPRTWFTSEAAKLFKHRIVSALHEDVPAAPLFVIKDPRMCRLVPIWRSILAEFGAVPLFVIIVRNPLEVAESLKARDGFSEEKGLLLWLSHFLAAERDTRGQRRSFVTYDRLLTDWRSLLEKVGRDLDVRWPVCSHLSDVDIDSFLSLNIRHQFVDPRDVLARKVVTPWVKTAFEWAMKAADGGIMEPDVLDRIYEALKAADTAFLPLIAASRASAVELSEEVARLADERSARQQEVLNLRFERDRAATERNEARAEQGRAVAEREEARAGRDKAITEREETRAERDRAIAEREEARAERDKAIAEREEARAERNRTMAAQTLAQAQCHAMQTSRSWRLTRPLREVGGVVRLISGSLRASRSTLRQCDWPLPRFDRAPKISKPAVVELIPGLLEKNPRAVALANRILTNSPEVAGRPIPPATVRHVVSSEFVERSVCIFAHWDPMGKVDRYIGFHIDRLRDLGFEVIFSSANETLDSEDLDYLKTRCSAILTRPNLGYDFGSWKAALTAFPSIYRARTLLLVNDSVFGPLSNLDAMIRGMRNVSCDFWGITESHQISPHLQSYFLCFTQRAVQARCFREYWDRVVLDYEYKDIVVNIVETKLSLHLALNGLIPGAVIPSSTRVNPTHVAWRALTVTGRTPYIKRDLLQGKVVHVDIKGWERVVSERGYDISLIQSHLRRFAP